MTSPRRTVLACTLVSLAIVGSGCSHSERNKPKGTSVTEDEMRPQIIAAAKAVLAQTGVTFDVAPELGWQNCNDNNSPPYRATITASFRGQPTLAESERQVDGWVARLGQHGWSKAASNPSGAARYLTGPNGFAITLLPHLDPVLQRAAYFVLSSDCVITEDLANAPSENITKDLN